MSGSQQIPCGRIEVLTEALSTVREESTVLVLACVTNLLTSTSDESSSVSLRVEPVLQEFLSKILQFGSDSPDVHILICPPMYRRQPLWYREGLPEILTKFSAIMSPVPRVQLMPSFPTPSFENEGVHLTPYSGLEYVLHLFDSANAMFSKLHVEQQAHILIWKRPAIDFEYRPFAENSNSASAHAHAIKCRKTHSMPHRPDLPESCLNFMSWLTAALASWTPSCQRALLWPGAACLS